MLDQASKLRALVDNGNEKTQNGQGIKIYSVASGKGGVGKTNFSVNLAIKLQQMGKRVLVLDADVGLSNANILLGINTPLNLFNLFNEGISLKDIIVTGPEGVDLLSGGSDLFNMEILDYDKQQTIINELSSIGVYDILIIDNGAGISRESLTFAIFAHELILVTTPEPTAITDAYSYLKAISIYKLKDKVKVVINQVPDIVSGEESFNKLALTCQKFLKLELENIGFIFNDIRVNKSVMDQQPIVLKYPNSLASKNIEQISNNILNDENYNYNVSGLRQLSNRLRKIFG